MREERERVRLRRKQGSEAPTRLGTQIKTQKGKTEGGASEGGSGGVTLETCQKGKFMRYCFWLLRNRLVEQTTWLMRQRIQPTKNT